MPFTVIEGPSAWIGSEIQKDPDSYIYYVSEADIKELDYAIAAVETSGVKTAEEVNLCLRSRCIARLLNAEGTVRRPVGMKGNTSNRPVFEIDMDFKALLTASRQNLDHCFSLQVVGVTKESFPLPKFGPKLRSLVDEGVHGRGFQMLRCTEH